MKDKTKLFNVEVPKTEDGMVGIRASLNNMGFSDKNIGFDDKTNTVTLFGKDFMKPGYYDDEAGVSYADTKDIQKSLVNFYSNSSDPIVRVSDAYLSEAGKYGLTADALTYGNGTVSIGGRPLDILYVDNNDKAWAWQSSVQDAVDAYADESEVISPKKLAEEYANKYLTRAENILRGIQNRSSFSYNPDKDPVYLAYKNKYMVESDRAARNSMANYAALTGGYMNSAAATAGAQAQQYYGAQLANTIPDLAKQAYERYADKYKTDMDLLRETVDMYDVAYDNAYNANKQQVYNINNVAKSNTSRDNAAYNRYWDSLFNNQEYLSGEQDYALGDIDQKLKAQEYYWEDALNEQELETSKNKNTGIILDNDQKKIYIEYYKKLLEADYNNILADTELAKAQAYKAYYR